MAPALGWAAVRAILMFHELWGTKSQDSVHRPQLLEREERLVAKIIAVFDCFQWPGWRCVQFEAVQHWADCGSSSAMYQVHQQRCRPSKHPSARNVRSLQDGCLTGQFGAGLFFSLFACVCVPAGFFFLIFFKFLTEIFSLHMWRLIMGYGGDLIFQFQTSLSLFIQKYIKASCHCVLFFAATGHGLQRRRPGLPDIPILQWSWDS